MAAFSATSDILPGSSIATDHLPVSLDVQMRGEVFPKGRGLQGFPLQLLNVPDSLYELTNVVHALVTLLMVDPDDATVVDRWDRVKETLRKRAWDIYPAVAMVAPATAKARPRCGKGRALRCQPPLPGSRTYVPITLAGSSRMQGLAGRLRDVRAAYLRRYQLAQDETVDLDVVMAWLPGAWRAQIVAPAVMPSPWKALQASADRPAIFKRCLQATHGRAAEVSLLGMSVKDAQLQLTHRLLQRHRVPGYREEGAAWPKARSVVPEGQGAAAATPETAAGSRQLELRGIHGQEELWRRRAAEQAGEVHQVDAWFRRDAGLAPAQPRTTRVSQAAAAEASPPLPQGFGRVWRRLEDATIHRPCTITCWRVLHCTLGCNAYLASSRPLGEPSAEAALCGAPECAAAGRVETLTHAFLDCPEVRPAIDWLLSTWHSLTGRTVPRTAQVLLADDPDGWPEGERPPSVPAYQLWTRLCVALLGAIWRVRCAGDEGDGTTPLALRAVTMALDSLLDARRREGAGRWLLLP